MLIDSLILARIQFALNITFHIMFPSITISLCWVLLIFKVLHNRAIYNTTMTKYKEDIDTIDIINRDTPYNSNHNTIRSRYDIFGNIYRIFAIFNIFKYLKCLSKFIGDANLYQGTYIYSKDIDSQDQYYKNKSKDNNYDIVEEQNSNAYTIIAKTTIWSEAYDFWIKIFALCFAIGVVTGVTMSLQFGTNWPGFMQTVGNIAGPLLSYEILTAFFLEATFLGIMLFGVGKVSNRIHTIATFLVSIGTTLSAFWILVLNSWMNTPVGFKMIDGKAYATNWLDIMFNPSMPHKIIHMLLASFLTTTFLISGVSAYRLIKKDTSKSVLPILKFALYTSALLIPLQLFVGDSYGLNTLKHNPEKIAAMEAIWQTQNNAPFLIFAIPDQKKHKNYFEIQIPNAASLILTHTLDGEVKGLNDFNEIPPVLMVFFCFRIMVGIGILMLITSWLSLYQIIYKKNITNWNLRILIAMTFSGWIAILAGWYVTEIGRQPYLVYGVLKTADAVSNVTSDKILVTLIIYAVLYVICLLSFISVIFRLANQQNKKLQ